VTVSSFHNHISRPPFFKVPPSNALFKFFTLKPILDVLVRYVYCTHSISKITLLQHYKIMFMLNIDANYQPNVKKINSLADYLQYVKRTKIPPTEYWCLLSQRHCAQVVAKRPL
jgi:hypothetical protein